jgi:hypothetical protein
MSMGNADVSASSQFRTASTPVTIAEIFNNYFSSVFTNSDSDVSLPPSQPPATDSLLSDIQFTNLVPRAFCFRSAKMALVLAGHMTSKSLVFCVFNYNNLCE